MANWWVIGPALYLAIGIIVASYALRHSRYDPPDPELSLAGWFVFDMLLWPFVVLPALAHQFTHSRRRHDDP